jgi:uncharacterized phage-associated protein
MKAWDLGHIITHYVNQKGDKVSHKKLQKLIYYVEAWHLVHMGISIVDEEFEAWVHGPVVVELFHELKKFGFNDIRVVNAEQDSVDKEIEAIVEKNKIVREQLDLIYEVLNKYGGLSSLQLELLSHSESPWINARKGFAPHENCNEKISKEEIKFFYSSLN